MHARPQIKAVCAQTGLSTAWQGALERRGPAPFPRCARLGISFGRAPKLVLHIPHGLAEPLSAIVALLKSSPPEPNLRPSLLRMPTRTWLRRHASRRPSCTSNASCLRTPHEFPLSLSLAAQHANHCNNKACVGVLWGSVINACSHPAPDRYQG